MRRFNRAFAIAAMMLGMMMGWWIAPAGAADQSPPGAARADKPNIVILLADDQGYNDLGCYGSPAIKTPYLDQMAAQGLRFTDFYSIAPVCSPSRAGLMTGCYAQRVGLGQQPADPHIQRKGPQHVLYSGTMWGLNPKEETIAEVLKADGYATACVGKWHLGDKPEFWPTSQGFDSYFGIPFSNDSKPSVLMRGNKLVEQPVNQDTLVERYTAEAKKFIAANQSRPFFLYLAYNAPHTPVHASKQFQGKSARGPYGDDVMTIDFSVGQVLEDLKAKGLDRNTLVIYTSDNGPWIIKGEEGGSAAPLRSGKMSAYEGGYRMPCIAWWPGKIKPGRVCHEIASTMDLLPTACALAGAALPKAKIDGLDISPLLFTDNAKGPHQAFFYYVGNRLTAVRSGKWKLKVATNLLENFGYKKLKQPDAEIPMALYNLDWDIAEQKDVSKDHPDVVKRLEGLLAQERIELGDEREGIKGKENRPLGCFPDSQPVWLTGGGHW
jgi:arylsulfatase A-like enzyme